MDRSTFSLGISLPERGAPVFRPPQPSRLQVRQESAGDVYLCTLLTAVKRMAGLVSDTELSREKSLLRKSSQGTGNGEALPERAPDQANEVVILKALSCDSMLSQQLHQAFSTKQNLQTRNSKRVRRVNVNTEQKRKVLCVMVWWHFYVVKSHPQAEAY